jgi:glycosyltransferase involved in cell wall biosynthesis
MSRPLRRVLAISWDMPPQSGPRAIQVSRTLREIATLGWHSDVICFDARSGRYHPDPALAARLDLPPEVTRIPVPSHEERLPVRALWRLCPPAGRLPDRQRVWVGAATRAALVAARSRPANVLVSFAQPWSDHLVGLRVHRALSLPWVAHFSDPWVEAPDGYARLPQWQRRLWARWERQVAAEAAALVFVNQQTADATMRKYPAKWRRKVHIVPHGFARPRAGVVAADSRGPLRLVYTGRFYGETRTPAPLLRAIARMASRGALDGDLRVTFVGPIEPEHQRLADALDLARIVSFTGRVPFDESERYAAASDVLLVIDAPSDTSLFLPSKLIEYLPLRKPILGLTPPRGAAADLMQALGYPVVAPDDEHGIADILARMCDRHRAGALTASPQHDAVAARYDITVTARAFAEVLDGCAA